MTDLIAALQRKAAITPPGKLISGYGYNDLLLGRHPNRHDLDKVSTTQPVIITHGSGHITAVNSFVLNEAGITKDCFQDILRHFLRIGGGQAIRAVVDYRKKLTGPPRADRCCLVEWRMLISGFLGKKGG